MEIQLVRNANADIDDIYALFRNFRKITAIERILIRMYRNALKRNV